MPAFAETIACRLHPDRPRLWGAASVRLLKPETGGRLVGFRLHHSRVPLLLFRTIAHGEFRPWRAPWALWAHLFHCRSGDLDIGASDHSAEALAAVRDRAWWRGVTAGFSQFWCCWASRFTSGLFGEPGLAGAVAARVDPPADHARRLDHPVRMGGQARRRGDADQGRGSR